MVTPSSVNLAHTRPSRRRQVVIDEALEHAVQIIREHGVGGLSISEVARRMGVRSPSLYRYFDSLSALYDALFAIGLEGNAQAVQDAIEDQPSGLHRIREGTRATIRWCVANPALAQLLYWRVIPGFEPTEQTLAAGVATMDGLQAELTKAIEQGEIDPETDIDEAVRLLTVQMSGLITQQFANEPGATFETGAFTSLTDQAIEIVLDRYRPRRT